MSLIVRMRRQRAVWWRSTGTSYTGQRTFDEPIEIKCRWENRIGQFYNAKGERNDSRATVYVDREMSIGDVLKEGELDSNTPDDPTNDEDAMPIKAFESIPKLNPSAGVLYIAHL